MNYLGDYAEDETVYFLWSTNDADGASVTRATNGTVSVYKDNGTTQTTTGVTDTEDFDSLTGIHACTIVTTDAFYTTGADYAVVLSAATIDGQTVNAVLAHFSIQNRYMRGTNSANTTTPPTAGAVADAVWDEALAGHLAAGSAGNALNNAGGAAADPWETALPGSYSVGEAGYILGTYLDQAVSSANTSPGAGAITFVYTLTDADTMLPIAGADVWATSDSGGSTVLASGITNGSGQVTFYLDAGTVYIWRQKPGYNFTNPDTETVS